MDYGFEMLRVELMVAKRELTVMARISWTWSAGFH